MKGARIEHSAILGDPDRDAIRQFFGRVGRGSVANAEPVFAMPSELFDAIQRLADGLLDTQEASFERELHELCSSKGAVGIAEEAFVQHSSILPKAMPSAKELGSVTGTGVEHAQKALAMGEARLLPLREAATAYLG